MLSILGCTQSESYRGIVTAMTAAAVMMMPTKTTVVVVVVVVGMTVSAVMCVVVRMGHGYYSSSLCSTMSRSTRCTCASAAT